jgi:hypothetical protein
MNLTSLSDLHIESLGHIARVGRTFQAFVEALPPGFTFLRLEDDLARVAFVYDDGDLWVTPTTGGPCARLPLERVEEFVRTEQGGLTNGGTEE